jgi:GNAT superfamily N-acetyltransferase
MRLRVMTAADIPAGLELCRTARWNQIEADWRRYLSLHPMGARVAVDASDAVIGTVTTLRYDGGFGWIAMVLVAPAHRRQGIASRLVEEAIDLLGPHAPVRLDATPAGELVYRQLAFVAEYDLARLERVPEASAGSAETVVRLAGDEGGSPPSCAASNLATAEPAAKHAAAVPSRVRAMDDEDFADVMSLDREVFGADRAPLLRMLRQEAPGYAIVDRQGSRLDGYAFGRRGFSFDQLGPIIARDELVARRLVGHVLTAHPGVAFLVDVPRRSAWVACLAELGFREQRGFVRLVRGAPAGLVSPCSERLFATIGADFG